MGKGKTTFTQTVCQELRNLISQREKADSSRQKSIREKLRKLGLYWSEVAPDMDYTVENFDLLFTNGILRISENKEDTCDNANEKKNSNIKEESENTPKSYINSNMDLKDIEDGLICGKFKEVSGLKGAEVPHEPGLYCIKLREGIVFPKDFGKIREDGIIYIGIASTSLNKRLWEDELNHKKAATFFRSIGAMLGYLPPKGSLADNETKYNYKFDSHDTELIKEWMKQSLLVNFVTLIVPKTKLEAIEKDLIRSYTPLVNIENNPQKSKTLIEIRNKCREWAQKKN